MSEWSPDNGSMDKLTGNQLLESGLDDWRKLAQALHGRFHTGDFATGLRLVDAVGEVAERAGHHPDVTLTYSYVDIRLLSHDVSSVTQRDVELARQISEVARDLGVQAEPAAVAQLELALDTADLASVGPFWAALLTGSSGALRGDEVVDPTGQVPLLWFQGTDAHDVPRQRFHVDLWVPHDVAEERIALAVAAGGTVVDDSNAPSFVVLADPEGNKACVCTSLDR